MNSLKLMVGFGLVATFGISLATGVREDEEKFAGAVGRLSQNYMMRGDVSNFLFRIDEAFYSVRYVTPDTTAIAVKGSKLMVVKYTVLNQDNHPVEFSPSTVAFSAKGSDRQYSVSSAPLHMLGKDTDEIHPGRSRTETIWFEVPANEKEIRLNVRVGSSPELGYDLRNQVKLAHGHYVDAKTKEVVDEVDAKLKDVVPVGAFDASVLGIETATGQILDGFMPGNGERFYIVTVKLTNATKNSLSLETFSLWPELYDRDGGIIEWSRVMMGSKSNGRYSAVLDGAKSEVVRYLFKPKANQIANDVKLIDSTASRRALHVRFGS